MEILNIITMIGWLLSAIYGIVTLFEIKDKGASRREAMLLTISMMSVLGAVNCFIKTEYVDSLSRFFVYFKVMENIQFGSAIFQILLCWFVVRSIRKTNK